MPDSTHHTLLIINDIPDQLMLMAPVLEQAGYRVLKAINGAEGFEVAQRTAPDLIISDVSMPGVDGIELCLLVRADEKLSNLPIILVTALRKDSQSVISGLKAGADDYLEAPYDAMRLVAKVARMLERKEAEAEREKLIKQLQSALNEIKTLQGILPICMYLGIRDDKGAWTKLETYIREHTNAKFSHGMCKDCYKKMFPEQYERDYPEEIE